eukprot:GHVP01017818.1.p1 GENE.GHVP01017818.1~~GHVP01017818.1.p1  ORF type:complete len:119 (-),score=4.58 GHVP01017818.1:289-645(-)
MRSVQLFLANPFIWVIHGLGRSRSRTRMVDLSRKSIDTTIRITLTRTTLSTTTTITTSIQIKSLIQLNGPNLYNDHHNPSEHPPTSPEPNGHTNPTCLTHTKIPPSVKSPRPAVSSRD